MSRTRRGKRKLHLKIRVRLTEPMTRRDARDKLARTVRTGIVQPGIELAWIDWRRPRKAGRAAGGSYLGAEALDALREFYGALTHDDTRTRVEVIHEG